MNSIHPTYSDSRRGRQHAFGCAKPSQRVQLANAMNAFADRPRVRPATGRVSICFKWLLTIALLVTAMSMLSGCGQLSTEELDGYKAQVEDTRVRLNDAKADFDQLVADRNVITQAIAHAQDNAPADPEARAEWDAELAKLREQLSPITDAIAKTKEKVDQYQGTMNDLADRIAQAQSGEEIIGDAISTIGTAVGTATGQVVITATAALIGGLVRGIGERKRIAAAANVARDEGAADVAAGIEANRNDSLEERNPGFIVVEKAGAEITHKHLGVADAIERSTSR